MKGCRWSVIFNWAWCGLSIASGLLVTFLSGWKLLNAYTPLFCIVLGILNETQVLARDKPRLYSATCGQTANLVALVLSPTIIISVVKMSVKK